MSGMDWVRGIIGVEAMVRHGKKLSEGKEKEMGLPLGIGLNVVNGGFTGR